MVCDSWKATLDTYLDGELSEEETRTFDAHVRSCPSCSADALARVQTKRAIQVAGKRFTPSAEFRKRVQQSIAPKRQRSLRLGWIFAAAAVVVLVVGALTSTYVGTRSGRDHVFSEIADLHVAMLASSSPVDVISSDRHTVKPWFQGKIPFAFDLPELQNSEFSLLGGRMTYLDQTPGAHLRCSEAPHFCVRVPGTVTASQVGREFSRAEETVFQHGNMESRRASLFRDRRRECR
jgi:anti-sigma factor RsiW